MKIKSCEHILFLFSKPKYMSYEMEVAKGIPDSHRKLVKKNYTMKPEFTEGMAERQRSLQ